MGIAVNKNLLGAEDVLLQIGNVLQDRGTGSENVVINGINAGNIPFTESMTISQKIAALSTSDITPGGDRLFLTTAERAKLVNVPTNTNTELGNKQNSSEKGQANGYAGLDASGKVPSNQLPSFVDDVQEFPTRTDFPASGTTGIIYIAIDTSRTFRWSGTEYIDITGQVDSVNGQTGAVVLTKNEVSLGNVENLSFRTQNQYQQSGWMMLHPQGRQPYPSEIFAESATANTLRVHTARKYNFGGIIKEIPVQDILFTSIAPTVQTVTSTANVTATRGDFLVLATDSVGGYQCIQNASGQTLTDTNFFRPVPYIAKKVIFEFMYNLNTDTVSVNIEPVYIHHLHDFDSEFTNDDVMLANGYTKLENGAYTKSGEPNNIYSQPFIWQTLNQGAFHYWFNERGAKTKGTNTGLTSGATSISDAFTGVTDSPGRFDGVDSDEVKLDQILCRPCCAEGYDTNWRSAIISNDWEWGIEGIVESIGLSVTPSAKGTDNNQVFIDLGVNNVFRHYGDESNWRNQLVPDQGIALIDGAGNTLINVFAGFSSSGRFLHFISGFNDVNIIDITSTCTIKGSRQSSILYRKNLPYVDVIGNISTLPQGLLDTIQNGFVYGLNYLLVSQDGRNLIPDGNVKNYTNSRKVIDIYRDIWSTNSGSTFSDSTAFIETNFNYIGNYLSNGNVTNRIDFVSYKTLCSIYQDYEYIEVNKINTTLLASNTHSIYSGANIFTPLGIGTGIDSTNSIYIENSNNTYEYVAEIGVQVSVPNNRTLLLVNGFTNLHAGKGVYKNTTGSLVTHTPGSNDDFITWEFIGFTDSIPIHNTIKLGSSGYISGKAMFLEGSIDTMSYGQVILNELRWDTTKDSNDDFIFRNGTISQTYTAGQKYRVEFADSILPLLCVQTITVIATELAQTSDGNFRGTSDNSIFLERWDGTGFGDNRQFDLSQGVKNDINGNSVRSIIKNITLNQ